jgi:phosphatidate cytidylyltransferase
VLKARIITGTILLALVLGANFYLPSAWFAVFLSLFIARGAFEWGRLMRGAGDAARVWMPVGIVFVMLGLWLTRDHAWIAALTFTFAAAGWCFVLWLLRHVDRLPPARSRGPAMQFVLGCIVLPPCWLAMVTLHDMADYGPQYVFFLIGLIALADTAAYFSGRAFGKNKLAPSISPGKTWEGVAGAVAATSVFGGVGAWLFGIRGVALAAFSLLCAVTVMFSIVGDLFESLLKRQAGVKDSGTIFPGHGGVLDRIDGFTAGAPVFAFGLMMLEGL